VEGLPGHPVRGPRQRPGGGPPGLPLSVPARLRRIVLLRHGRTGDNAGGRIQGQIDTPLDDVGRAQAAAVAQVVPAPDLLLSSDLVRARDTAAPLALHTGLPVRTDARLRELDLGAWQGLTSAQARESFPDEHAAWRDGRDVRRGGGETYLEAGERAVDCLREVLPEVPAGGGLLAVTHGGTARAVLGLLLGSDPDQWWRFGALSNCCWTSLVEHPRGWRLEQHGAGIPAGRPAGPVT